MAAYTQEWNQEYVDVVHVQSYKLHAGFILSPLKETKCNGCCCVCVYKKFVFTMAMALYNLATWSFVCVFVRSVGFYKLIFMRQPLNSKIINDFL